MEALYVAFQGWPRLHGIPIRGSPYTLNLVGHRSPVIGHPLQGTPRHGKVINSVNPCSLQDNQWTGMTLQRLGKKIDHLNKEKDRVPFMSLNNLV